MISIDNFLFGKTHGFIFTFQDWQQMNKDVPLLFVASKEDASVAFGKSVEDAVKLYRSCGMKKVSLKLYDNCRHCIFQDYEKAQVIADVIGWLEINASRGWRGVVKQ